MLLKKGWRTDPHKAHTVQPLTRIPPPVLRHHHHPCRRGAGPAGAVDLLHLVGQPHGLGGGGSEGASAHAGGGREHLGGRHLMRSIMIRDVHSQPSLICCGYLCSCPFLAGMQNACTGRHSAAATRELLEGEWAALCLVFSLPLLFRYRCQAHDCCRSYFYLFIGGSSCRGNPKVSISR